MVLALYQAATPTKWSLADLEPERKLRQTLHLHQPARSHTYLHYNLTVESLDSKEHQRLSNLLRED